MEKYKRKQETVQCHHCGIQFEKDSSLGYIKGNIQFISIAMNHMKNNMSHNETLELIEILKNNNK